MKSWNTRVLFLPAVLGIVLCACIKTHPVSKEIYSEANRQVRLLEERDRSDKVVPQGFEHPWEVDTKALQSLLASVHYQKGIKDMLFRKNKPLRAFPEEELQAMLPHLQKAFSSATADQYVDFSFIHKKSWTIFQRNYLTDGLLFRKGNNLHCAFRNIAFEEGGAEAEDSYGPFVENPTSKPVHAGWSFVLAEGQKLEYVEKPGLLGSKTYPNWIQLDLSFFLQPSSGDGLKAEKPAAVVPATPVTTPGAEASKGVSKETATLSRKQIEEKLRFLDEIKGQGLIAPASYEEKRQELLRALEALPPNP